MRVNVYAEEMTDKVQIISKTIDGQVFTGLRFYLELPATVNGEQHQGPFIHKPGDDDSAAVTFWGKRDLRDVLHLALRQLDRHYGNDSSDKKLPYDRVHKLCDNYNADYNKTCAVLHQLLDRGYLTEVSTAEYVQPVPDHCDRIVWRNNYYNLPLPPKQPAAPLITDIS